MRGDIQDSKFIKGVGKISMIRIYIQGEERYLQWERYIEQGEDIYGTGERYEVVDLYQNILQLTTRVTAEFHQDSNGLHQNRSR